MAGNDEGEGEADDWTAIDCGVRLRAECSPMRWPQLANVAVFHDRRDIIVDERTREAIGGNGQAGCDQQVGANLYSEIVCTLSGVFIDACETGGALPNCVGCIQTVFYFAVPTLARIFSISAWP